MGAREVTNASPAPRDEQVGKLEDDVDRGDDDIIALQWKPFHEELLAT